MGAGGSPRANAGPQSLHMGLWGAILGVGGCRGPSWGPGFSTAFRISCEHITFLLWSGSYIPTLYAELFEAVAFTHLSSLIPPFDPYLAFPGLPGLWLN